MGRRPGIALSHSWNLQNAILAPCYVMIADNFLTILNADIHLHLWYNRIGLTAFWMLKPTHMLLFFSFSFFHSHLYFYI